VQSAKLRLFCNDASVDGGKIYSVSNQYFGTATRWVGSGLTWNKAPALGGTLLDQKGAVSLGAWVEFDVTAAMGGGDGVYSFGMESGSTNIAGYDSKEGVNRPQLVISASAGVPPSVSVEPVREFASSIADVSLKSSGPGVPREWALRRIYPNPLNARTSIRLEVPRSGTVNLAIFDVMGRAVRTLVDGELPAGVHEVSWDGHNDSGARVSSGVYLVRFRAHDFSVSKKVLLRR